MFEVGERIVCIKDKYNQENITVGKIYIVKAVILNGVYLTDDIGRTNQWNDNRFISENNFNRRKKIEKIKDNLCLK